MNNDKKINYGFWSGSTIYELGSKNDMLSFFDIIDKYCDVEDKELVTKELKIRYIKFEDVYRLDKAFKEIDKCFSKLKVKELKDLALYQKDSYLDWNQTTVKEVFHKFIKSAFKATEGTIWSIDNLPKERMTYFRTMKVVLTDIPYTNWIEKLPQELIESFDDDDKPLWSWDIEKIEEVVKMNNPKYKDVFHAVYVLKDDV